MVNAEGRDRMTLYEIKEAIRNFEYDFDPETGELLNDADLQALDVAKTEKLEAIACLAKEARSDALAIRSEVKSLVERADSKDKRADYFEKWLAKELENKPFETSRVAVTFRKSQTTDIIEEGLIPEEYMVQRIKTETKPDKERLKKALKEGKEIPGVVLTDHYRISVK